MKINDYVAEITNDFADISSCSSSVLMTNILEYLSEKDDDSAKEILDSICIRNTF